ncbi:unnamed protein product [Prorocentrum cordatum]|uniref:PX domain-containing protein n=1 Tax=Prorocentrum cordatum TaxID=2364126 RepID=A0ABN9TSE7_9DINO|nr:unnamed protein product [Polarella glacialis]
MAGWPRHDLKWNILAHGGRADKSGPTMYDTCMTFSPGAAQVLPPPLDLQQDAFALNYLQDWQRWSAAKVAARGSGGPVATATCEGLRGQDQVHHAIVSLGQDLAQISPADYYDPVVLVVASAACDSLAPQTERQFFAVSIDAEMAKFMPQREGSHGTASHGTAYRDAWSWSSRENETESDQQQVEMASTVVSTGEKLPVPDTFQLHRTTVRLVTLRRVRGFAFGLQYAFMNLGGAVGENLIDLVRLQTWLMPWGEAVAVDASYSCEAASAPEAGPRQCRLAIVYRCSFFPPPRGLGQDALDLATPEPAPAALPLFEAAEACGQAWVERPETAGSAVNRYTTYLVRGTLGREEAAFSSRRRYSDFEWLRKALVANFPGVRVPPLPRKQRAGRFEDAFVEARRSGLEDRGVAGGK